MYVIEKKIKCYYIPSNRAHAALMISMDTCADFHLDHAHSTLSHVPFPLTSCSLKD